MLLMTASPAVHWMLDAFHYAMTHLGACFAICALDCMRWCMGALM